MRLIDDNGHRRALLRLLMQRHGLNATQVATLDKEVKPQTVRLWMCGLRSTPKRILRVLRAYRRPDAAA